MVFNNRYVCLAALTIEILIEHVQVMSFLRYAPDNSVTWNSDAHDAFKGLEKIALRFDGDAFIGIYITAAVVVFVALVLYIALNEKLHQWNRKQNTLACIFIWFFEHIIFGIGYIPIISQFVAVQYCAIDSTIESYSSLTCWEKKHMTLLEIGYIFSGFALFLSGVIGPVFKAERPKGIERKFGNESYFIGIYKLLLFGVVFLFGPIHSPVPGLVLTILVIAYMLIWEAFAELHVASMYMGVLMGQMWVFACAIALKNDSSGSEMLAAWPPFILFGYAILPIKSLVLHRVPRQMPIEKQ